MFSLYGMTDTKNPCIVRGRISSKGENMAETDAQGPGNVPEYDGSLKHVLFSFKGRCTRFDYWVKGRLLPMAIFAVYFIVIISLAKELRIQGGPFGLVWIFLVPFVVLFGWVPWAVLVKRCHDRNHSWRALLPFGGLRMFELGFSRGTVGPNKYGQDPLQPQGTDEGQRMPPQTESPSGPSPATNDDSLERLKSK